MKRIFYLLGMVTVFPVLWAMEAPSQLILTYMGNPSTTITVNWQTFAIEPGASVVYYDTVSKMGIPDRYAMKAEGEVTRIEGLNDRDIHIVELTNLEPATEYFLVAGDPKTGISREIRFRTIPEDARPLRFVTGGDMGASYLTRVLLRHAASYSPDFSLVGGDIAYANGRLEEVDDWDSWLRYYSEEMVTPEGLTIPVVFAIGNHEVVGSYGQEPGNAPFFFGFFGQDSEKSYFVRQFGENLVFFVLDSGHVASHELQAGWLREQMEQFARVKYKAALYHVPLYPSHREFEGKYSELGRKFWGPLFDEYGLTVAFENHDHTFKRSHLLKNNTVSEDGTGTLYLGDGCWGRNARSVDEQTRWYLAKSSTTEHFWLVDVASEGMTYRAIDKEGDCFDRYSEIED